MESGAKRGLVVLSAIVLILISIAVFLFLSQPTTTAPDITSQGELPPPTTDIKTQLYENLQKEMGGEPEPISDDERQRIYEQLHSPQQTGTETETETQTQVETAPAPAPSESDRKQLLEGVE
ncbi:hypothetical protein C4568_00570 [Candidatus Parcubacteria bacterium]|nr:MAG: hypothetical protein C4568_00570 [Candidatus Parcubacteria bacterium]